MTLTIDLTPDEVKDAIKEWVLTKHRVRVGGLVVDTITGTVGGATVKLRQETEEDDR
jgi:hypothetical protein